MESNRLCDQEKKKKKKLKVRKDSFSEGFKYFKYFKYFKVFNLCGRQNSKTVPQDSWHLVYTHPFPVIQSNTNLNSALFFADNFADN